MSSSLIFVCLLVIAFDFVFRFSCRHQLLFAIINCYPCLRGSLILSLTRFVFRFFINRFVTSSSLFIYTKFVVRAFTQFVVSVLAHVTCPHPSHVSSPMSLLRRWHAFEYGVCSVSCGGGVRIRTVQCVQGVLGSDQFAILPDAICPPPAPTNRMPCGMVDCTPEWHPDEWSEVRHA